MTMTLPLSYHSWFFSVDKHSGWSYLSSLLLLVGWLALCTVKTGKNNDLSFLPSSLAGSSVFWPQTPATVHDSWLGQAAVVFRTHRGHEDHLFFYSSSYTECWPVLLWQTQHGWDERCGVSPAHPDCATQSTNCQLWPMLISQKGWRVILGKD